MEFFIPNLPNLLDLPQCIVIPTPLPISEHPLAAHAPNSAPINPYNASNNFFQFINFLLSVTFINQRTLKPKVAALSAAPRQK